MSDTIRVSAAELKITPYGHDFTLVGPMVKGTGVYDDLFARAIILNHNKTDFAIITMDLVGLDIEMTDKIRDAVRHEMKIPAENVMINYSHTHSAPITAPWHITGNEEFKKSSWREELVSKAVDLVKNARSNSIDCKIRFGSADVQVGMNRRLKTPEGIAMKPNPDGVVIPWVDAVFFESTEGKLVAALFSHAAHPVNVHSTSTMIGADYPGFAVSEIKKALGSDVVAMFAQGCGGNINSHPLRGGLDSAQKAGENLGQAVVKAMHNSRPVSIKKMGALSLVMKLPFQKPPSVEDCDKILQHWEDRAAQIASGKIKADLYTVYTKEIILSLKDLKEVAATGKMKKLKFEIQCLAVSDEFCIVALMHEVFAEYHLYIKEISPFKDTMVFAYSNGCESYIPCEKDFELGGYEAGKPLDICSSLAYTRLWLEPKIEIKIKEELRETLNKLFSATRDVNNSADRSKLCIR